MGITDTWQNFSYGSVYAAYGGIFILLAKTKGLQSRRLKASQVRCIRRYRSIDRCLCNIAFTRKISLCGAERKYFYAKRLQLAC